MPQMTGAQAAIATLHAHDVQVVFGMPGAHTLPLYDAMYGEPGVRHVLARHEQGAGFMAGGYARASGKPGVVCTTTGPGLTNVATPVADAYADSVPVLVLSSGLPRAAGGHRTGALHEVKDQLAVMQALAGWSRAVSEVEEIPYALCDALSEIRSGRPRAAYLEIPLDLLAQQADIQLPPPAPVTPTAPGQAEIKSAAELLRFSRRPLIVAGVGVTAAGANEQLGRLAEVLQAPVLLGAKSRDVLPTGHPWVIATTGYAMSAALLDLIRESDAVVVVGSKMGSERTGGRRLPVPEALVHIDIDPSEIGRQYPAAVSVAADARLALEALLTALAADPGGLAGAARDLGPVRAAQAELLRQAFGGSVSLLDAIRATFPAEGIVVADMTRLGYASARYLPVYEPRTFIHPSELCAIGCGLPIGLGARLGAPQRPVIVLAGDGGVVLNISELATAVQEGIDVTVVVFNDAAYTAVKNEQRDRYNGRYISTDVRPPDFVRLAAAYGAHGVRAHDADELATAIGTALDHVGPTLIEVPLHELGA